MRVLNTYHLGYPNLDNIGNANGAPAFLAVLVDRGDNHTVKVYSGIVKLPDASHPAYTGERDKAAERVMHNGQPESFRRAVTFFPGIDPDRYAA